MIYRTFNRGNVLAAVIASLITFIIMAATRPAVRTRFVAADGSVCPAAPLDRMVDQLDIENMPLRDAIHLLAWRTGISMQLQSESIQKMGLNTDSPVNVHLMNVTAGKALDRILASLKMEDSLGYWDEKGIIQIGTSMDEDAAAITSTYDVRKILDDFIARGSAVWTSSPKGASKSTAELIPAMVAMTSEEAEGTLKKLIEVNIESDKWQQNRSSGQINCIFGQLIVSDTPRTQDDVEALLYWLLNPQSLNPPLKVVKLFDHPLRWPAID